jgi:hypothetical protein
VKALICEFTNLDEIACSETTARSNRFVPGNLLYRSSIAGALLQASLLNEGRSYSEEFNNLLWAARTINRPLQVLRRWYKELIENLPNVAITDALAMSESVVVRENFNSIYFGTSTALGSLKNRPVCIVIRNHPLLRDKRGTIRLGRPVERRCDLGLEALDFTVLRPDPKRGSTFPSIREVMTARVGADAHTFWSPGAQWRMAFISPNEADLEKTLGLFRIVLGDLGMGAKHAFRGKGELRRDPISVDVLPVTKGAVGSLWQPLICRNGDLGVTLDACGLAPTGGMQLSLRHDDLTPIARGVPAVSGEFRASKGYYFHHDGKAYILTEEDLRWPRQLG